ncbi:hypothetical protein [Tautonia rosea]|uniref:hypothetical protein n=1 Tax=Tautonia rosea TaxID=2728037 RepID=UPI001473FD8B|nr:hypothetical protein [Tautonia rosea]
MRKLPIILLLLAGCAGGDTPIGAPGRPLADEEIDEASALIAKYAARRAELHRNMAGVRRAQHAARYAELERRERDKIRMLLEKLTERRFDPASEELARFGIDY